MSEKAKSQKCCNSAYSLGSGSIVTNEVIGHSKARLSSARQKKGYILNTFGKSFFKNYTISCVPRGLPL